MTIEEFKNRLKKSKDFCYPHWSRFIDNYRHYLSKLNYKTEEGEGGETKKYPFSSKITTGISFDVIETMMPRIIGRNPEFVTAAIEPEDIPYEQAAKMTIEYEYQNPKLHLLGEPIYLKLQKAVREALITGTAVLRSYWRREKIKRAQYKGKIGEKEGDLDKIIALAKKNNLEVEYVKKYEETPFLDDFDVLHLPFFFFFPDPLISETGKMRYKIERAFYTKEELLTEAQTFGYDLKAISSLMEDENGKRFGFTPDIDKDFLYQYFQLFSDTTLNDNLSSSNDDKIPLFIVDKMWEGGGGKVHVFVNEKYQLTPPNGIPSPYDLIKDPFVFVYNIPQPHLFYGRSEIDAFKRMEDAINDFTNMRGDNLYQAMSSIYLINPKILEDANKFLPYPNSVWMTKDINFALKEIKGQDVTASVYKEVDVLYNYIQRVSGISDYVKGAEGMTLAGRTYGGLRLAQEVANVRLAIKSTLFEEVTLRALGYMMLEMSRQFFTKDRIVRLAGTQAFDMGANIYKIETSQLKSIKGFMDIQVIPSSTRAVDEQAEAMKLNSLFDRMGRPPLDKMTPNLYYRFLLKYLPLFGFRDAIYWIRELQKNEGKKEEKTEKKMEEVLPQAQAGGVNFPVGQEAIMSSAGVQNQPSPLEQILANQV